MSEKPTEADRLIPSGEDAIYIPTNQRVHVEKVETDSDGKTTYTVWNHGKTQSIQAKDIKPLSTYQGDPWMAHLLANHPVADLFGLPHEEGHPTNQKPEAEPVQKRLKGFGKELCDY